MGSTRFFRTVVVSLALAMATAACGNGGDEASAEGPGTFVGEIAGADLFVGIGFVRVGEAGALEMLAYVSDGAGRDGWFPGRAHEVGQDLVRFAVTSRDGRLESDLTNETARGTVTLDGQNFEFTAPRATGNSGVFRSEGTVEGKRQLTGWVVLPDGRQKGVVNVDGQKSAAPALTLAQPR